MPTFSAAKAAPDISFYSESGIYYQNYKGTIEAILDKSEFKILYITSDSEDPVWDLNDSRLMPFYINKLIPFIFPFINTKVLVMTMADLDKDAKTRETDFLKKKEEEDEEDEEETQEIGN